MLFVTQLLKWQRMKTRAHAFLLHICWCQWDATRIAKKRLKCDRKGKLSKWTYLVHEHVQWGVNWFPLAAGHRYKSEPHADVKPLAVTGASQNLRRSPTSARPSCAVKGEKRSEPWWWCTCLLVAVNFRKLVRFARPVGLRELRFRGKSPTTAQQHAFIQPPQRTDLSARTTTTNPPFRNSMKSAATLRMGTRTPHIVIAQRNHS